MELTYFASFVVTATAFIGSAQGAATIFTGGLGDTASTLSQYGLAPGPTIEPAGGNPGGRLLVTVDTTAGGLQNGAAFDRTQTGTVPQTDFTFQFQIVAPRTPSADGFHFVLLDTATFGTSGAGANQGEDPAAPGVLGFGFDTWSNNGSIAGPTDPGVNASSPDDPNQRVGSNYEEISLFYNGNLIQRINDTRLLTPGLTLDDGAWHTATGNFNFAGATASLSVDGNPIMTNTAVPGLVPFESRVQFGGRTGGETENASIDNLNVSYVPEPTIAALGGVGLALMLRRRRRDPR
jgi:hypothetical protein